MKNVVIVGFGFMGSMHAQVYQMLPAVRIAAVVDSAPAIANANAVRIGLKTSVYPTLKACLAAEAIDIVDVCLPTSFHGACVREAIKAGKHVFCEKPFASTAREAKSLAALAARARIKMQIGQCIRFWPEYQAFVEFVASKKAGRLLSLSLQRRAGRPKYSVGDWLNEGALSGGAALDLHIHDTDFVVHLLGRPRAVSSVGTKDVTGWSHIFTTYHYKQVAVTAEGGWNYAPKWGFQMAFQAVFERGTVDFDSGKSPTLTVTDENGDRAPLTFVTPAIKESSAGVGNVSSLGGYFNELQYFVQCLEDKKSPSIATPAQAAESVAIVQMEIRSAASGRKIKL